MKKPLEDKLTILVEPGKAPVEEVGVLLAEISRLYRICGGSGIRFECTGVFDVGEGSV